MQSCGKTDVGMKRKANEDAFLIAEDLGLYAVADGMGGHAAGEVASQEALDNLASMVRHGLHRVRSVQSQSEGEKAKHAAVRLLESAVQAATYMVYALAEHDPDQKGMGTTLSAMLLLDRLVVTAQVGDSRIYRVREQQVRQLTEDHTLIAWQLSHGLITEQQALESPHKNVITRAVGSRDYVQVDTQCVPVEEGDAFIVCSDGLHGYLEESEIAPVVALGPEAAADKFIELANTRGGRDNITVIILQT